MKDLRQIYNLEEINKKIEEVKRQLAEFSYGRQHGRAGVTLDNPYDEYERLLNNLRSRQTRAKRKEHIKCQDKVFNEILNIHQDEDEYGISPRDERRYKAKFKSGYIGAPVYVKYIMMMTGLKLFQIYQLQERTGLIPTPRVTKEQADADYKHRWETGDIY